MTTYRIADPCPRCSGGLIRGECYCCAYSRQDEADAEETRELLASGALRLGERTAHKGGLSVAAAKVRRYLDGDQGRLL